MSPPKASSKTTGKTAAKTSPKTAPKPPSQPSDTPRPLRVLSVASEMYPFVKTGGLADVVGALPEALRDPSRFAEVESGMTLVGFAGIKDPARPEVRRTQRVKWPSQRPEARRTRRWPAAWRRF